MADEGIVALREALGKILECEHVDLLREGVALLYRELMEAEVAGVVGAERYERSEDRVTIRNGYRSRQLNTRVGSIELAIPKLRSGSYFPSFLEPRKRSEQALLSVVATPYQMLVASARYLPTRRQPAAKPDSTMAATDSRSPSPTSIAARTPSGQRVRPDDREPDTRDLLQGLAARDERHGAQPTA